MTLLGASGIYDYTGRRCRSCDRRMDLHAKREVWCIECAELARVEVTRSEDCPLICDKDWIE